MSQGFGKLRRHAGWAALCASLILGGCSDLPQDGPLASDVVDQAHEKPEPGSTRFAIIDLNTSVAAKLAKYEQVSLHKIFGDEAAVEEGVVKAGDYVTVTIWNIGPGGISSGGTANATATTSETVPEQMVARDGSIAIPFAGRVSVGGATIEEASERVRRALAGKVMQPQVILTLSRNMADNVVISGDDVKGMLYTLSPADDRILDAIAAAGGVQSPTYQAQVRLIRDRKNIVVGLQQVITDPAENIRLHPRDVLVVSKNPQFVTALGALGKSAEFQFANDHMTLAEAVGTAGGLLDERADNSGIFIFRFVPKAAVLEVCPRCSRIAPAANGLIPVVYRLDMSRAEAFFVAQHFAMVDRDVMYVSNSPKVQLGKFLTLVGQLFSPVLAGAVVARDVQK
jgi:polysaccharide export outer membrane protein